MSTQASDLQGQLVLKKLVERPGSAAGRSLLKHRRSTVLACLTSAFTSFPAYADPRCDCAYNKIVGVCTAAIARKKDWVEITTPGIAQCSMVVWDINGYPQVSSVTDGLLSEPLINVPNNAEIEIRSCKICEDRKFPDSRISAPAQDPTAASPALPSIAHPTASGTWSGYTTSFFGKQDATLQLTIDGTNVSGTYRSPKFSTSVSGTVNGGIITLSCTTGDGPMTWTLQLSADSLQGSWRAGMFSGSVQLRRQ